MILYFFMFLLSIYPALPLSYSPSDNEDSIKIIVKDNKIHQENPLYLMREPDDYLELSCALRTNNTDDIYYNLTWTLPGKSQNRPRDYTSDDGSVKLVIDHVQENDSGMYKCETSINQTELHHTVQLFVSSAKQIRLRSCEKMFLCDEYRNHCIPTIYACDGKIDCKTKTDESLALCGPDPCLNRIKCPSGRCIPQEWCLPCDPDKTNCTNKGRHECCPDLGFIKFSREGSYGRYYDPYHTNQHYNDMSFLQTTIFTVIGCAMVFMIIVTILVIAICRVHMKRTLQSHVPNNRRPLSNPSYHRALTQEMLCDLDLTRNRSDGVGLLVTYNINNGVQIVGSPIEPPPYSEVASLPPREGPPPPYTLSTTETAPAGATARSEVSPKARRPYRHGLSNVRVSSEPTLLHRL